MGKDGPKGAYNKALIFVGENYMCWKDCMYMHLIFIDRLLWVVIYDNPFISKSTVYDIFVKKDHNNQIDEETYKTSYNLETSNILIFALKENVYFSISHCKTAKIIWVALQVLQEGIEDVEQTKINTLTNVCELFHMEPEKSVASMQMRFSYIINKLENLGKCYLRFLTQMLDMKIRNNQNKLV